MTAVAHVSPHLDIQCPEPLRHLPNWLIWRFEGGNGGGKPRKVPHYAGGGRRKGVQGGPDDRARLVTFDAALAAARRKGFDGVGIAILEDCGFDAIDFDDVVQNPAHFQLVSSLLAGTYAEFSPSGNGVRGFVVHTGEIANIKSHAREGHAFTFETFASKGFVTFTGNVLPGSDLVGPIDTITPPSDQLLALYRERIALRGNAFAPGASIGTPVGYSIPELANMLQSLDPAMSYPDWIKVGMALHHECAGSEEAFHLWDEWSSQASNYETEEACLSHWVSFRKVDGPVVTIRSVMKMAGETGGQIGAPVAQADAFDVVEDSPEEIAERKARADRFGVILADDFSNRPPPKYLIQGVLPAADLVIVYGDSGSGKSFAVTDMAMAIARGEPWRGLRTRKGRVVYIVAEGAGGYSLRLKAYSMHHGVNLGGIPFGVINAAPNLLQKDDIRDVIAAIKAFGGADLVVIDTLAQTTPGANENAAEDMGLAIKNARAIGAAAGGVALLVHHSGKDATKGARGWSGMRAAADAQLEVVKLEDGTRVIQTTKQKDGKDDGRWGFRLETVLVAMDEEGEPITSCVLVDAEAPPAGKSRQAKPERLGVWEQLVLETLGELQLGGDVKKTDLVIAVADKAPDKGTLKFRRASARRAVDNLSGGKKAVLVVEEGYVFDRE